MLPESLSKNISSPIVTSKLNTGVCEKVTTPPEEIAIASVSEVCPIFAPLIIISSTVRVVNVPTDVRLEAVTPDAKVLPVKSPAAAAALV